MNSFLGPFYLDQFNYYISQKDFLHFVVLPYIGSILTKKQVISSPKLKTPPPCKHSNY